MIPLSIETKLITIVLMALLNLFLLKRKRNPSDSVETYMIQAGESQNVSDRNADSGSLQKQEQYAEKFVDVNNSIDQIINKQANSNSKQTEQLLFVRLLSTNIPQHSLQFKPQNDTFLQINPKNSAQDSRGQHIQLSLEPKQSLNQPKVIPRQISTQPIISKPSMQISPLLIPMQQEQSSQEFYDFNQKFQSNVDAPKPFKASIAKPSYIACTERKFTERKFPSEAESQSDSNTKRTEINLRYKQKSQCKDKCQSCKHPQPPRETLKRCLKDLIYSTFEQMLEKKNLEQNIGHKKKKRSL